MAESAGGSPTAQCGAYQTDRGRADQATIPQLERRTPCSKNGAIPGSTKVVSPVEAGCEAAPAGGRCSAEEWNRKETMVDTRVKPTVRKSSKRVPRRPRICRRGRKPFPRGAAGLLRSETPGRPSGSVRSTPPVGTKRRIGGGRAEAGSVKGRSLVRGESAGRGNGEEYQSGLRRRRAQRLDPVFRRADALFGTRRGSASQYADAGAAHLLQRIEDHQGSVILTTNGKSRIDQALSKQARVSVMVGIRPAS